MPDVGKSALVCVDKMDSRPGVDAVLYFGGAILPLIQGEVPQARLYIMGMKPQPRLRTLAGRPGMDITGVVLLCDLARRAALGQATRTFVSERYNWATTVPKLEAVFYGAASLKTL